MKQLTQFIQEKLHVNKFKGQLSKFAEYLNITVEEAKPMEKYFDINVLYPFIEKPFGDFITLMFLAALLAEDDKPLNDILKLGTNKYTGKGDPYIADFDVEDDDMGIDFMEFVREYYGYEKHEGNSEMRDAFEDMYKFCKKYKIRSSVIISTGFIDDFDNYNIR